MGDRTSEASPNNPSEPSTNTVPLVPVPGSWAQQDLFGVARFVITPKLIIDGPSGTITVSVTIQDFDTLAWLGCEVRPCLRFPHDLDLALDWIVALSRSWSKNVSPF